MSPDLGVRRATRKRIARLLDGGLPLVGVAVVVAAVLLAGGGWAALWLAVGGLLLVEAGAWRLGSRVMHGRRYLPLRREVERFIGLARELNASAAVRGNQGEAARQELDEILESMRGSLDRMVEVAGKTEAELEDGPTGREARSLAAVAAADGAAGREDARSEAGAPEAPGAA